MLKFLAGVVVFAAMALGGAARADSTHRVPAQLRLELDLVDGSRITGAPDVGSVPVQTSYAKMDIPLVKICTIRMAAEQEAASFVLRNGDRLKGVIALGPIMLETAIGQVTIDPRHIRELRVVMVAVRSENFTSSATGMEFVWIAQMNMWVGKYEVTNGEYRKKEPGHDSLGHVKRGLSYNGDRQPVVFVDFDMAKAYAAWLTERDKSQLGGMRYRLPSEQEFMTYIQCGDGREYPWGNYWPPHSGRAGNYHGVEVAGEGKRIPGYRDGHSVSCDVEKSWANPWGLFGVGGNVWEACARDSSGEEFGAWRGGSWNCSYHGHLRSAFGIGGGSARYFNHGFRLVLSP